MNFGNAFRIAAVVCLGAAKVITAVLGDKEAQSLINSTPITLNSTPCQQPNINFYDYNADSRRGNVQYVQPIQVPVYQCYPAQQYVAPQPVVQQYVPAQAPVQQYVQPQQVQMPIPMAAPASPQAYTVPTYPQQQYNYNYPAPQPVQTYVNYTHPQQYQAPVQPATYSTYQNVNYVQPQQYPMNNNTVYQEQQRAEAFRQWEAQARNAAAYQAQMQQPQSGWSLENDILPMSFDRQVETRFNLPPGTWYNMGEQQRLMLLRQAPDLLQKYQPQQPQQQCQYQAQCTSPQCSCCQPVNNAPPPNQGQNAWWTPYIVGTAIDPVTGEQLYVGNDGKMLTRSEWLWSL